MVVSVEGIIWYVILLDAIIYNVLCWTQGKLHDKATHWISKYFPIKKLVGIWYLIMVLWIGSALLRMNMLF